MEAGRIGFAQHRDQRIVGERFGEATASECGARVGSDQVRELVRDQRLRDTGQVGAGGKDRVMTVHSHERAQVRGNDPAKPINTAVGMLPPARHAEGHLYQPFVPRRQP